MFRGSSFDTWSIFIILHAERGLKATPSIIGLKSNKRRGRGPFILNHIVCQSSSYSKHKKSDLVFFTIMKDINLDRDSFHLLIDPVYGPNSQYFWPGSYLDAGDYMNAPTRGPVYVSGEEFLEEYAEELSGVLAYRDSTDYPEESYCNALYDKFYSLYNHVESWDTSTLFVSAVYRDIFHKMFPYQSQLCELKTRLDYESRTEPLLKRNLYDEAFLAAYGRPVKETDKIKRKLSSREWEYLMGLIFYPYRDRALILELMAVLNRTNIVATHQKEIKEGLLMELEYTNALSFLGESMKKDIYGVSGERLVWGLSLLQIGSDAAEKAVDETLSLLSYGPIISLIQAHSEEKSFVSDTASAYYIAPRYTATDYIRDLVRRTQKFLKKCKIQPLRGGQPVFLCPSRKRVRRFFRRHDSRVVSGRDISPFHRGPSSQNFRRRRVNQ